MSQLYEAARKAIFSCMGVKRGEKLLILTDEEADALFGDPDRLELCRNLYLSADVLLTLEQEQALKEREIQTHIVPDCFYETELMEVGER